MNREYFDFNTAQLYMSKGRVVTREGYPDWFDLKFFMYAKKTVGIDVISTINRLPDDVKKLLVKDLKKNSYVTAEFSSCLCAMLDGTVLQGIIPSEVDTQAKDWYIVEINNKTQSQE